jgi:hypothetical protein
VSLTMAFVRRPFRTDSIASTLGTAYKKSGAVSPGRDADPGTTPSDPGPARDGPPADARGPGRSGSGRFRNV